MKHAFAAALAWLSPAVAGAAGPGPSPVPPTTIGINLAEVRYWSSTVPFANLVISSEWVSSDWKALPDGYQDRKGNIVTMPADGVVHRLLSIPPTGPAGFEVRCTWTGSGSMEVWGPAQRISAKPNLLRFRGLNLRGKESQPWLVLRDVDMKRPPRDLDCRDVQLDRSVRFRPQFLANLRPFRVIRFMDWQNANANQAVAWRDRETPDAINFGADGVSIEDMLALVRELGADPWFVMPWNADADYISRFAQMVRAGLPAGRKVYVEVGNEVWNTGFPAGRQAMAEGQQRGLGAEPQQAQMRRYAQRTGEVMRLWEAAFAGRDGLVRVLSTQHVNPETARLALSYGDTAKHVDALATAPYWGTTIGGTGSTRESSLQHLATELPMSLAQAADNRKVALSFGKRYIAYEGGAGLVLPAQVGLSDQLQHDPAMYDLYRQFLTGWREQIGDTLCLFHNVSRPGAWGSWGLQAWEDETPAEAPKFRAVLEATGSQPR